MALVDAVVLLGREDASDGGLHAQRLEVVARRRVRASTRSVCPLKLSETGGVEAAEDVREGLRLLLEVLVHRVGRHARCRDCSPCAARWTRS